MRSLASRSSWWIRALGDESPGKPCPGPRVQTGCTPVSSHCGECQCAAFRRSNPQGLSWPLRPALNLERPRLHIDRPPAHSAVCPRAVVPAAAGRDRSSGHPPSAVRSVQSDEGHGQPSCVTCEASLCDRREQGRIGNGEPVQARSARAVQDRMAPPLLPAPRRSARSGLSSGCGLRGTGERLSTAGQHPRCHASRVQARDVGLRHSCI